MTFAVKLLLDSDSSTKVESFWLQMKHTGVSPYMAESGHAPHVTLMGVQEVDASKFKEALQSLAQKTQKIPFSATNIGVFPYETCTVYLGITHTERLRALHCELHQERDMWGREFTFYYEPEVLVPHITLACRLNEKEALEAAALACQLEFPLLGEFSHLALVDVATKETLLAFELSP